MYKAMVCLKNNNLLVSIKLPFYSCLVEHNANILAGNWRMTHFFYFFCLCSHPLLTNERISLFCPPLIWTNDWTRDKLFSTKNLVILLQYTRLSVVSFLSSPQKLFYYKHQIKCMTTGSSHRKAQTINPFTQHSLDERRERETTRALYQCAWVGR